MSLVEKGTFEKEVKYCLHVMCRVVWLHCYLLSLLTNVSCFLKVLQRFIKLNDKLVEVESIDLIILIVTVTAAILCRSAHVTQQH